MATYYYYEDATGSGDGSSEANAYDGSTSATLPDGSSNTATFKNVITALQSGDTLYVKNGSSAINLGASTVINSNAGGTPADHNDQAASDYGFVSIIGYQDTIDDQKRAEIFMSGFTLRYRPMGRLENLSFTGSYSGDLIMLTDGCVVRNCRLHKTSGSGSCIRLDDSNTIERCEIINDYSTSSAGNNCCVSLNATNAGCLVDSCYIEAGNGVHGVYNSAGVIGTSFVQNCIINLNLDKDGSGNSDGDGIHYDDLTYERTAQLHRNIIHNAKNAFSMGVTDSRFGSAHITYNIISSCEKVFTTTGTYTDFYYFPTSSTDTTAAGDRAADSQLIRMSNNFYYSNTDNGDLPNQEYPTYLTSDPFVDVANKDFTLKSPDDLGYAKNFLQAGASGDTITRNALVNIAPFSISDSGTFALGTGGAGDEVTVSGRIYQKVSDTPIVWRVK